MNDTLIREILGIDHYSSTPMYLQLTEKLEKYIQNSLPGAKLPTERAIAESLGVNRETVRKALKEFVERGLLSRGRKGTIVSGAASAPRASTPHPFLREEFCQDAARRAKVDLKFACYENYPEQIRLWEEMTSRFNETSTDSRVSIEWVPNSVADMESYARFIEENGVDVFLLSHTTIPFFEDKKLLSPMPMEIRQTMLGQESYWRDYLGASKPEELPNCAPFAFVPWLMVWNKSMMEELGCPGFKERYQKEGGRLFAELAAKLPPGARVSGNVWTYSVGRGMPKTPSRDAMERNFQELRDAAEGRENVFITEQAYLNEDLSLFSSKKLLSYTSNAGNILNNLPPQKFEIDGMWFPPAQGYHSHANASCAAVSTHAKNEEEAWTFIKHVVSEEGQFSMSEFKPYFPFNKKAALKLGDSFSWANPLELDQCLKSVRSPAFFHPRCNLTDFLTYDIRDIYKKILTGALPPDKAAEQAWARFKAKEKSGSFETSSFPRRRLAPCPSPEKQTMEAK